MIVLLAVLYGLSADPPCDGKNPFDPGFNEGNWCNPANAPFTTKGWPFCSGKAKAASWMSNSPRFTVYDSQPYTCQDSSKVLRPDANLLICADYAHPQFGEAAADLCTDRTCCAFGICDAFTCPNGWEHIPNPETVPCLMAACDLNTCCKLTESPGISLPRNYARGLIFNDEDPDWFEFGGKATILRASDESDITHYAVYWAFSLGTRKNPKGSHNPVSWKTIKWADPSRLLKKVAVTGGDITFDIPMNTPPSERCPISRDVSNRLTAATDQCNPHYLAVISVNQYGESPIDKLTQQNGPMHPIADYQYDKQPCVQGGIVMGKDLPSKYDVVMGKTTSVEKCRDMCKQHNIDNFVVGGSTPPCRYFNFATVTGGPTGGKCWIEGQSNQRSHFTVRNVGPAVCQTPDNSPATGKERTRCTRWIRYQNTAPWTNANIFSGKGWLWSRFPQKAADIHLGLPTNKDVKHPQECQVLCELDVLCVGFSIAKMPKRASTNTDKVLRNDGDIMRCILLHIDEGVRKSHWQFDTWMCSRGEMSPFVLGYDLQKLPFGYFSCSGSTLSETTRDTHDCCAAECKDNAQCKAFTYWQDGSKKCQLYADESTCNVKNKNIDGCAYESCYQGYGKATYIKQAPSYEIIDTWPRAGSSSEGIPVRIQTNGLFPVGTKFVCVAALNYMTQGQGCFFKGANHFRPSNNFKPLKLPNTAEELETSSDYDSRYVYTTTMTDDPVATIQITKTISLRGNIDDGQFYDVKCGPENAAQLGAATSTLTSLEMDSPSGFFWHAREWRADGACWYSNNNCGKKKSGGDSSVSSCAKICKDDSNCDAFSFTMRSGSSGKCTLYLKPACSNLKPNTQFQNNPPKGMGTQCWKRDFGGGRRLKPTSHPECTGTCSWEGKMGIYEKNLYMPKLRSCVNSPCSAAPCLSGQSCTDESSTSYKCTCDNDGMIFSVDGQPTCVTDECSTTPCGDVSLQTCSDPNTSAGSLHDFTCTCVADNTISQINKPATCSKDECSTTPCGTDQDCNDPNPSPMSLKDFTCTCKDDSSVFSTGTQPQCVLNECTPNPCGMNQDCSDPNTKYASQHDYWCSCKSDSTIKNQNAPATCDKDECNATPCGADQTCNDPNPLPNMLNDFTCSCNADMSLQAVGGRATCTFDECVSNPCGQDQDCVDPDTGYGTRKDFVCTCKSNMSFKKTGAPALCSKDECTASPCGSDQTCADPNPTPDKLGDFVCTCTADTKTTTIGVPATCSFNECDSNPCGTDQTCVDQGTSYSSRQDYVCTCKSDTSITKTGAPARCSLNECDNNPCGIDQTCADTVQTPTSVGDFTCTCNNYMTVITTGTQATCEVDECSSSPCGTGQSCNDPNLSFNSQHDFVCTCDSDMTISDTDSPAICEIDECLSAMCGTSQTCSDPKKSPKSLSDYICTCDSDTTTTAVAAPVPKCTVDECVASPCGTDQTCLDPNTKFSSPNDYTCTCKSDTTISEIGRQPVCSKNECDSNPCGTAGDQTCNDPKQEAKSLKDFTCVCNNDASISTIGTPAVCTLDECTAAPCGVDQDCVDTNTGKGSLFDYTCTCKTVPSVSETGKQAVCSIDECTPVNPCGTQVCTDTDKSAAAIGGFQCACPNNGPTAIGKVAVCNTGNDDECVANPCGMVSVQTCLDPNPTAASQNDFVCTCVSGTGTNTGAVAVCLIDECTSNPCGAGQTCTDSNQMGQLSDFTCDCVSPSTGTSTGTAAMCVYDECLLQNACTSPQMCNDPVKTQVSLSDYTCTCANGEVAVGNSATCELDECTVYSCGSGQSCNDPLLKYSSQHDYVCTCDSDTSITKVNGPAVCEVDECLATPCTGTQTCNDPNTSPNNIGDFVCTCTNGQLAVGGAATCEADECLSSPCGTGQTCSDPSKDYLSRGDFVCTCTKDTSITKIGQPARCELNECDASPCRGNQTCSDPNTSPTSKSDYTCTCDNGISTTGGPAICTSDECLANPCGVDQVCDDPKKSFNSIHDYTCTCISDSTITQVGHPSVCEVNECDMLPCGNQTCNDPDTAPSKTGDFTCSCDGSTIQTVGGPAVCEVDECIGNPCGVGQTCNDPNKSFSSQHDLTCTCDGDSTIVQIDHPAHCELNECDSDPCHFNTTNQVCVDVDISISSLKDFTCTCSEDSSISAKGGRAICTADECLSDPCDDNQTCFDPTTSYATQHDYTCTCDNDPSIVQIDHAAKCFLDECFNSPCGLNQTCNDPNMSFTSLKDFTCTCSNNVKATGGKATCVLDECQMDPYPCSYKEDQTCVDPNDSYLSQHDYVCTCKNNGNTQKNGPASCFINECFHNPCGKNQTCDDPSQDFEHLHDYECTCKNNGKTAIGGMADCRKVLQNQKDECEQSPCGSTQHCHDNTFDTEGDYICTCLDTGDINIGGRAKCSEMQINECNATGSDFPCGSANEQVCEDPDSGTLKDFVCSCKQDLRVTKIGNPADCTNLKGSGAQDTNSDDDSSLLLWILIPISVLLLCACAGAAWVISKKKSQEVDLREFCSVTGEMPDYVSADPQMESQRITI